MLNKNNNNTASTSFNNKAPDYLWNIYISVKYLV